MGGVEEHIERVREGKKKEVSEKGRGGGVGHDDKEGTIKRVPK